MVDHINRNGLDNRAANLRFIGHQGNKANSRAHNKTSQYIGVSRVAWSKSRPYAVQAKVDGRVFYIGRFSEEVEAARCYDKYASERFGPLAVLNFPE